MNDATPDPTVEPDRATKTTRQTVDVATAAARLGITSDAVRARIRRGKLQGEKRGSQWFVVLPDTTAATPVAPAPEPERDNDATTNPGDTTPDTTGATATVDLAPLAELIERLSRENADLSAAAAGWQARAIRAEEELKQLTATVPSADESAEPPQSDETDDQVSSHQQEKTSVSRGFWARIAHWWDRT